MVRLSALRTGRTLLTETFSGTPFSQRLSQPEDIAGLEELLKLKKKNSMISSGLEPYTFRLATQRLNQLRYGVGHIWL
jgi:hypothetical protein